METKQHQGVASQKLSIMVLHAGGNILLQGWMLAREGETAAG